MSRIFLLFFEHWNLNSIFSCIWVCQAKLFFVNSVINSSSHEITWRQQQWYGALGFVICMLFVDLSWEPTNYSYFRWSRAYYIGLRAPHTNTFFRSKMCPFSHAFSHTFHTKTPLRKLFLKVESSQNALFWKRSVSTVDSWNGKLSQTATKTEKGHIRSFQFNQRFRTFQCEREAKTHQKVYVFPNENALVWSNNNMKTAVWAKIFCFVLVETETEFFKTH